MNQKIFTSLNKTKGLPEKTPVVKVVSTQKESHIYQPDKKLINRKALMNIRSLQIEGTPDILTRIISLYLKDTPRLLNKLRQALHANDAQKVRSVAHSLKTSCANLGALSLSALFKQIELKGHTNSLQGTAQLFAEAKIESQKVVAPLRAEMTNP